MYKRIIILLLILQVSHIKAQENNNSFEKTSDAIYITGLEFGIVQPSGDNLSEGLMFKWCSEYRFKNHTSPFIRLNIDTYDIDYSFSEKDSYELNGKTQFIDFIIGGGYRLGKGNTKFLGAYQFGASLFAYPSVNTESEELSINEKYMTSLVSRFTLGVEYYLDPRLALTFEVLSNVYHTNTEAWNKSMSLTGFTIGFTSVIF